MKALDKNVERVRHMFNIRKGVFRDASRIAELCGQLGYPSASREVEQRLDYILNNIEHALFVAEGMDEYVVGWAHVHKYVLPEADLIADVGGIIVDKNHRGKGIGRKLVYTVEAWAWENGSNGVSVRSNVIRKESHRFYEALGYTRVKEQIIFRKTRSES